MGSLLFCLYLSDFSSALAVCSYNFYADDLQIYAQCTVPELAECIERVNDDVSAVAAWCETNALVLNAARTRAMILLDL